MKSLIPNICIFRCFINCRVRSRAISTFAHCMGSEDQSVASVVRDIMTPQVIGGRGPMTRIIPTPGNIMDMGGGGGGGPMTRIKILFLLDVGFFTYYFCWILMPL